MISSSPRPELYRGFVHPVISVTVPVTGMLALLCLGARLLGTPGPPALLAIGVILAPLVEAAVGNVLYRERAGIANRVRELIILLLVFYVIMSLGRGGPVVRRFVPTREQLLPLLAIAATWWHAFAIHNRLRGREGLLRSFRGKQGDELRRALIDRQHDMALTVRELRHARATIVASFIAPAVLAVFTATGILTGSSLPAGSIAFVLLAASGLSSALGAGAMNAFMEEYAANGEGLAVPSRFGRRRFIAAAALVLVVAGGAFALSRTTSLLPLDAILAFLRWLGSLFDREPVAPPAELLRTTTGGQYERLLQLLQPGEPVVPPLWARMLAELLRRLAVAVIAAAASILVFGPLFSPAFRRGLMAIRPGRLLGEAWRRLVRQLSILVRWLRTRTVRRGRRPVAMGPQAAPARRPDRWRPSAAKRRQMDRVVAVFAALARWGAERGLPYRPSEAANEYLLRVGALRAEHRPDLELCRQVFWSARYSRETVPPGRMREYVRAVRRITGSG